MNEKIKKILNKFGKFDITNGYRMLMLIDRNKKGKDRNSNKSIRKISKNKEEFIEILKDFLNKKKENERIYSCVNERDINKAIRIFKQHQLEADYYDDESKYNFYLDIKNRWLSSLMRPQAKKENWFLIDIDTKSKFEVNYTVKRLRQITANFIKYETENGYHIICSPFNPNLLDGIDIDIKKDGLLLLDY